MDRDEKKKKFESLVKVILLGFYASEYKTDPKGFKQEIDRAIDHIFADEFDRIKLIAGHEKELIRKEAEIHKLKGYIAIQKRHEQSNARIDALAREIREKFRKIADPELAKKEAKEQAAEELKKLFPEINDVLSDIAKDFDKQTNKRLNEMNEKLNKKGPKP
jgi:hypothetical protein